jgi:predicted Ser/Thr protein kinase
MTRLRDLVDELLQAKVKATLFGGDRVVKLGRLEIRERLGAGAMGTVFAAHDPRLARDVAVKVVRAADPARVLAEARALAKLQHPNVVAVYDADALDGLVYIVMELVQGASLRAWRPESWRDVARVLREAASGIAAAHAAGLVHRDIKPENILVGNRARVGDFGLARTDDDGTRGGTPGYMAPELADGAQASALTDQYAFGVTLRETLERVDGVPRWLVQIAERASAREPAARYPSLDAIVAALGRDRRRVRVAVLAAAALACGAVAGAFAFRSAPAASCERQVAAWSPDVRARVGSALAGVPWGARTTAAVDDAAARWSASYRRVCEARPPDALLELRERCLDRAVERLAGLVGALGELDAAGRVAAPAAVAELPAPEACETLADAAELALPAAPEQRAAALAAERQIDRAWSAVAIGRYRDARGEVSAIERALAGITAPRVRADELALASAIEARIGDPAAARARLDDALVAAAAAHAPALELDIWARRLRTELFAGDPARVIEWETFARAAAARAGRGGAELDGIVGEALRDSGRLGPAREVLERALASADPLRPEQRARIELNLASVELAAGRSDEARPVLERARERVRIAFGDRHPELALYDDKLAAAARAAGRGSDALALHDRSLELRTAAFGPDDRAVATALFHRAQTELELGQLAVARADLDRALAIRAHVFGDKSPRLGELHAAIGDVALAAGDAVAARAAFARAAIDPRLELAARRIAAGEPLAADAIRPLDPAETLSIDRAAALDARATLLSRTDVAALAAALRPRLVPELDPALAISLAHVLLLARDPAADAAYRAILTRIPADSLTGQRARRDLATSRRPE